MPNMNSSRETTPSWLVEWSIAASILFRRKEALQNRTCPTNSSSCAQWVYWTIYTTQTSNYSQLHSGKKDLISIHLLEGSCHVGKSILSTVEPRGQSMKISWSVEYTKIGIASLRLDKHLDPAMVWTCHWLNHIDSHSQAKARFRGFQVFRGWPRKSPRQLRSNPQTILFRATVSGPNNPTETSFRSCTKMIEAW